MSKILLRCSITCLIFMSCGDMEMRKFDRLIKQATENLSREKYDEALAELNDAIDIKSDTNIVYLLRGQLFYETEKYEESKGDFQRAVTFNNQSTEALFYLGVNCANLQQHDSAILYYNRAY